MGIFVCNCTQNEAIVYLIGIKELQEIIVNIEAYLKGKTNLAVLPELISKLITVFNFSTKELNDEMNLLMQHKVISG